MAVVEEPVVIDIRGHYPWPGIQIAHGPEPHDTGWYGYLMRLIFEYRGAVIDEAKRGIGVYSEERMTPALRFKSPALAAECWKDQEMGEKVYRYSWGMVNGAPTHIMGCPVFVEGYKPGGNDG